MDAKKILLLMVLLFIACFSKADTIDYWHVSYNKIPLRKFNLRSGHQVIDLKLNNIHGNDVITINYFQDAPCESCVTTLTIEDDKQTKIAEIQSKGTFTPLRIPMKTILLSKRKYFTVYRSEKGFWGNRELFSIRLL